MTTASSARAESLGLLMKLLDPSQRDDPYPLYQQLREYGPIQVPDRNINVFSSFQDCNEVLRHPAVSSDRLKSTATQRAIAAGADPLPFGKPAFVFLDPPDHTRLRALVSKAFSPRVVRALESDITALVSSLLDKAAAAGRFDVVADLAYPLPIAVMCRLLGVPLADEPEFSRASARLARFPDPFLTLTFAGGVPEGFDERTQAESWSREYLKELIDRRRSAPGDDLLSGLIAVEESGDHLTEHEIISTCNLLFLAGHETTVNHIANAILAMLRHPAQWTALADDPRRASAVAEETLRYDPPVQMLVRIAGDDITVGGVTVQKGDMMLLLLAAAHRDPAVNDCPDEFDPDRKIVRHLAFGHGAHFCIGVPLARLEAAIALSAVTARFPHARMDSEPTYKPNATLRGMSKLPVTI